MNDGLNVRLILYGVLALALAFSWGASLMIWRAAEMGDLVAPLDPRSFATLEVIAVGTGSAWENPERLGPCIAVGSGDTLWLVDAGRGVAEALRHAGIPVAQPRAVLLTSLMPENTVGLDDLLLTGFLEGRDRPLRVVGPVGTRALVEGIAGGQARAIAALGRALDLAPDGGRIEALEVSDGWSEQDGPLQVTAAAFEDGPTPARVYAFAPTSGLRRRVVVSGAGWVRDALVPFARGANLLVVESAYVPTAADVEAAEVELDVARLDRERALHTSIEDVGGIAARAQVDTIALVRLRPPPYFDLQFTSVVGRSYDGRIEIPDDGDTLMP